jgi:hypothetical protein
MFRIIPFLAIFILAGCATQFLVATNFHDHLQTGMTKAEFIDAWQSKNPNIIGATPTSSRRFTHDGENWEILIYSVYEYGSIRAGRPSVDHKEYVAFRNGILEEWGVGTLPLSLQGSPTVIHVESGR